MTRPPSTNPDFYEILNLPFPNALSRQQLKVAYHKALLKHHPDKAPNAIAREQTTTTTTTTLLPTPLNDPSRTSKSKSVTVDEITAAYKTLSDPLLRADYDRSLRLDRTQIAGREKAGTAFHTGLETVDLEDLVCDEGDGDGDREAFWYRGCRCGDERGFLVSERDLEREAEHGEIVVGCRGCSLWMKVLFAVQDDREDNEDGDMGGFDVGEKT